MKWKNIFRVFLPKRPLPDSWHNPSAICTEELTEEILEEYINKIKDDERIQFE